MPRGKTIRSKTQRLLLLGLAPLLMIWLASCSRLGSTDGKPAPEAQLQGKQVYDRLCAACHDATNLQLIKTPPKLDGLFSKAALPSGAPATDEQVRQTILHGKGIMPPFEQTLSGDDVDALIRYLHTR